MDSRILSSSVRLNEIAHRHAAAYRDASPFPHIVLDELFDADALRRVVDEFPTPDAIPWTRFRNDDEDKLASADESDIPPRTRSVLYQLNSSTFLRFLERLTGVTGLVPDPHFFGGGLHLILPGGKLNMHTDFSRHPESGLYRRLNLLLYLNAGWEDAYGGHLELWDRDMTHCVRKVAPLFNRMVIFSTSDLSFHGHPEPVRCPPGMARRSLALYYYTALSADGAHEDARFTSFRVRPGERRWRRWLDPLLPPLAYTIYDKLRGR